MEEVVVAMAAVEVAAGRGRDSAAWDPKVTVTVPRPAGMLAGRGTSTTS